MDPTISINKRVDVAAVYQKGFDVSANCTPHKMHLDGKEIVFERRAFHHPTAKGQRMVHVFDMTDGLNDYRLEFDAESLTWTLIAIVEGGST